MSDDNPNFDHRDNTIWRENPEMEYALRMKRDNPAQYDKLSADTHMAVGYYSLAKAGAKGDDE